MKKIFTNEQMYESASVMSQVEETGMLGYAIAKNRRKLIDEVKEYDTKRTELLKKYGKDSGDGRFELSSSDHFLFIEEITPFSSLTSEIDVVTVSLDVFTGGTLTSQQMFVLDWMVEE